MERQRFWVPNTPISSQQVQPSIEPVDEQSSTSWGLPPPLQLSQIEHSSTSWSPSVTESPSQTPQPQPVSILRIPFTPITEIAFSQTSSELQSSSKELTKNDQIHVLRLAIQAGDAYGHGTDKAFWQKITNAFEAATGRTHQSLARAVNNIVKARRKYLAENNSGEEDKATSYTDAVDDWISIMDARKALNEARKEAQGNKERESKASLAWRDRNMKLWSDRDEPQRLAKKRKLQQSQQASQLSRQTSLTSDNVADIEASQIETFDEENPFSPFPSFMDQSTPISSMAASPGSDTSVPEGKKIRRRKHRWTKTPQRSVSPDLPTDFHRFVECFIARGATQNNLDTQVSAADLGITELKADVGELKAKLGGLEQGISSILRMLGDGSQM
jgi:hypothetical protein